MRQDKMNQILYTFFEKSSALELKKANSQFFLHRLNSCFCCLMINSNHLSTLRSLMTFSFDQLKQGFSFIVSSSGGDPFQLKSKHRINILYQQNIINRELLLLTKFNSNGGISNINIKKGFLLPTLHLPFIVYNIMCQLVFQCTYGI